ncbi:MAG: ABC transporter permease [Candidatus Hydrogenedentes bacterium]|nr:ABC transporter permease [Candidatus Hydrogenedentota bacterium]
MIYFSFHYILFRTVVMGFRSLWLHRLRSFLTMLGVVFGVASVIAMLAVGEGASYVAQEQIRKLGSRNIIIRSVKPPLEQRASVERSRAIEYGIKREDAVRIRNSIPNVEVIVPNRIIRDIVWNNRWRIDAQIVGTVSWFHQMRKLSVIEGRYFTEREVDEVKNVCVLSVSSFRALFPMGSALYQSIRIGSSYYKVIGIIEDEDTSANIQPSSSSGILLGPQERELSKERVGQSEERISALKPKSILAPPASYKIYIPISCAQKRFGETLIRRSAGSFEAERVELHEIITVVDSEERVEEVAKIVEDIFQKNHKQRDYEIVVPLELLRQAQKTKQIFNLVLGTIAGISLLVGGIGIMNIMLATVTERTREIGIRRALGAKKRDIVIQFLVEAVIMSGTGGIFGIILGFLIPEIITYFSSMPTIIQFWSPLIAFGISAGVGILFGIYPAFRAANMDPIEALRHE